MTDTYISVVLAIIVFSLMLMVIRLRFEVRSMREELDRIAASPRIHMRSGEAASGPAGASSRADANGEEHLRNLVARGRKIEAIKEARELYNLSLKDAKDYVDSL
ncbi:ribosomal protein L7/L12 [Saccharibacillus sp. CPCC 101409]|uniref:ribosomal protein L7/L12 n=1 Tax=Saccharibacillus sp. CPCC 101409 TaxID=3058041 RepID=UPI0026735397|nr:ribosomal protein L7/L12 [Saccharibacillus sp. CPCC 101409]MDO3410230.1 ribosomal protein L7/L12 [Saccharibacillus sp. CPCC 101409]